MVERTTAPEVPRATTPAELRNVVLVGHAGSGKTTLVEALLVATGVVARAGSIADGSTVCDFDPEEVRQQRSVGLSLAPLSHDGVKVNLLDAPGYPDFVGELRAGLRAADAALFVVGAADGVDAATRSLWEECAAVGVPRAIAVTKLDQPRADFDEAVAIAQRVFGEGVQPVHLPLLNDVHEVAGVINLINEQVSDYSGPQRSVRPADEEHSRLVADIRGALIEAVIAESEDEGLMDRYLDGEPLDPAVVLADLETAVARGALFPVVAVCATTGVGTHELLELMVGGFPSPVEHQIPPVTTPEGEPRGPLTADPAGPLCAEVIKTSTDPYVGRISLVRVFSGTLEPDATVHVSGHLSRFSSTSHAAEDHDEDERVGVISTPLGAAQRPSGRSIAGDICSVAKLSRAETGDTLSSPESPLLVEPWVLPEPLLPVAIVARTRSDEDKLANALARLAAEDPTLRVDVNPDTHQVVLWCMGEAHRALSLHRLQDRYGVAVDTEEHRVSLRETLAGAAEGHGRHVKQSGGHGQFAICRIRMEPLPSGSGVEFVDQVVGGAIPRSFIPSVEKGIRHQLQQGVSSGYPMVDVRVTLLDGKAHSVDSSDMAFQTAGALAVKDAAESAGLKVLEPVHALQIVVADEYVGTVMSDLPGRRGRVSGSEPIEGGRTLVRAEVPEAEIGRYAIDLRSLSHGTGSFTRQYLRHEAMPAARAAEVLKHER